MSAGDQYVQTAADVWAGALDERDATIRELQAELDAAVSRAAALEATLARSQAEANCVGNQKRIATLVLLLRKVRTSVASGEEQLRNLGFRFSSDLPQIDDALSGGTAALAAHDAALVERIATAVEGLERWRSEPAERADDGEMLDRDDVLATIRAKGG